jgi:hypothetical protein
MDLSRDLATLPLWLSGPLLVGGSTLLVTFGSLLVHRLVGAERLSSNNEVAGFKFSTLGVLYAVLLAFAIIVVWEKFRDAKSAVIQEAGTITILYRLANGLDPDRRTEMRTRLIQYAQVVIAEDWPEMARGRPGRESGRILTNLYDVVLSYEPDSQRGGAAQVEMLDQLNLLAQSRRLRYGLAPGVVPGVVWLVLVGGAVVTISFTFFFGTQDLAAQVLMTAMLALMMFMGLFVVVCIEHPFTGAVRVTPEPLALALERFDVSR